MLRPAEPGQIYGDLVSNGFASARFHFCRSSFNHGLRWRVFSALTTLLTLIIYGNIKNVKLFLRKIVKMFTINHILHEFRFFVTVFLRKIVKTVKFTRKVDKTSFILANVVFFVKVKRCKRITPLPVVQDRQILNGLKGGALKLQRCKRLTLSLPVILTCLRSGDLKLQMGITEFGTGMSLLRGVKTGRALFRSVRTWMSIERPPLFKVR